MSAAFANPFLACEVCGKRVRTRPALWNEPCGHAAPMNSVCPSWSPVDGCQCLEHLGKVEHRRLSA